MITIQTAGSAEEFGDAAELLREYMQYIADMGFDDCIAGDPEKEIQQLAVTYPPDQGGVYIAYVESRAAGIVALERQQDDIAEIRRLFVRPAFRGQKIGEQLIIYAVNEAKRLRYRIVRLDTFRAVDYAANVYRTLGFHEIPPYSDLPSDKIIFMEYRL